jgi:hypothetical protein
MGLSDEHGHGFVPVAVLEVREVSTYRSRAFGAEQIRTFLHAVDRHLTTPVRVEIIGGSAAALAYGASSTTTDLDTFNAIQQELLDAVAQATEETGFEIPVSQATVADVPYNYEDRLERQLPSLRYLEVWVLEKHDLVLSKTVRCYEHDLQQIIEMHQSVELSYDVLIERFESEMTNVIGDLARIRSNFLIMIETVFGELPRTSAEKRLKSWGAR